MLNDPSNSLIAATIVDKDDLVVPTERVENGLEPGEKRFEAVLLIADRHDD